MTVEGDADRALPAFFNPDLEVGVLGAILIDNDLFWDVAKRISALDFVDGLNADIWRAIDTAVRGGRVADPIGLKTVVTIPSGIIANALSPRIATAAADTLADLSARRRIYDVAIAASERAVSAQVGEPVGKLLDEIAAGFVDIRESARFPGSANDMREAMQRAINLSAEAYKEDVIPGIPWVIPELESLTGEPLQYGSLYGVMADPGGGKTSFALQQCYHAAENGFPALFLSYEQTPEQCADQINSQHLDLEARLIRQGRIRQEDFDRLCDHADRVIKMPLAVQSVGRATVKELRVRAESFVRRHGRGLVVVDHAKRVLADNQRDGLSDRVNQVYGDLKAMAMDLGCAVIVLMQRNSRGFDRTNPEPVDEDCYGGSGAKENLDYLLAIWREYLWLKQKARLELKQDRKDDYEARADKVKARAKFINLKARFAQAGGVRTIGFVERFTRFESRRADSDQGDLVGYDLS